MTSHRRVPQRRLRPRHYVIVGGVTAVALTGGIAYAAWSSTGSGSASAKAGTAQAPTTGVTAVTVGDLYPGGKGTAKVLVNNPNPYPVKVTTIAGAGAATATGGSGTCSTTGVTFTTQTLSSPVAANGSATLTLADAVSMSTASDNGCQNAGFTIPVTVTVVSG
ncbi:hypothetical protein AB5J62_41780 [Amycolatopsis sp. cg5]|uniref:hypothetical protein n=1 Tax=Amycolatopsis sp. cg5 TaxID=3238802 RepID=UPI003523D841